MWPAPVRPTGDREDLYFHLQRGAIGGILIPLDCLFVTREVVRMKSVFGAPFGENDVDTIVAYLMSQNGKQ